MRPPLRAELYRHARARSTWVLLLLPAVAGVVRILGERSMARVDQLRQATASADIQGLEVTGFGPLADGLRTGSAVLTLALLVVGALAIVRERETGALALAFLGRSRASIVTAKALVLTLLVAVGFAVLFAACTGVAAALYGLGPIVDEGYEIASVADLWQEIGRGCLPALPGLLAAPMFGLFISAATSSTGGAVAGTLVPVVLVDIGKELHDGFARILFVTYAPLLGDGSPLAKLPDMARFYVNAVWRDGELSRAAAVPGVWVVALVVAAIWITRSRSA